MSTATFIVHDYEHGIDTISCGSGWCDSGYTYPKRHKDCGGLVHADFGDENDDCDYWLYTKCDKCGEELIGDKDMEEVR